MPRLDITPEAEAAQLGALNARFVAGDGAALFRAIGFCGNQQIPMPDWIVKGFHRAMNKWWTFEVKTLDEAFGMEWPKGQQLKAARKRFMLETAVFMEIKRCVQQGDSLTPELFVQVGRKYGIGKTTAFDYYKSGKAKSIPLVGGAVESLLEPFLTKAARLKKATRKISKLSGSRSRKS